MRNSIACLSCLVAALGADATAQAWQPVLLGTAPPAHTIAMSYDSDRDRTVLFSRKFDPLSSVFNGPRQTWERVDGRWLLSATNTQPAPVLESFDMVYDAANRRTLLCGDGQTWSYDGTDWQSLTASWSPARAPSLAYDSNRGVVVMFDAGLFYEWVSGSWIPPGNQTPLMFNGQLLQRSRIAFHPGTQQTVLFGGNDSSGVFNYDNRTLLWDGTSVTQAFPANSPFGRIAHSMTTDRATGRIVMCGGTGFTSTFTTFDEVFEWNGSNWLAAASLPGNRRSHAAVSDSHSLWLYGGLRNDAGEPAIEETTRTASTWTRRGFLHAGSFAAHDPVRLRTVSPVEGTTLEFDGYEWMDTGIAPPLGVIAIGWHGSSARIVAIDNSGGTWQFDGMQWSQAASASPVRVNAALAYDPLRDMLVMFGGSGPTGITNDLFEWDGASWTQRFPTNLPPASVEPTMCWNGATGRIFMAAAGSPNAFEWDGVDWVLVSTQTPTPAKPRVGYAPVFGIVMTGQSTTFANGSTSLFDGSSWTPGPTAQAPLPLLGVLLFDFGRGALMAHDARAPSSLLLTNQPAEAAPYGTGCAGAAGSPRMSALVAPGLGERIVLDVHDAAANTGAFVLAANDDDAIALPGGCTALLQNPVVAAAAVTNASGFVSQSFEVPRDVSLLAAELFTQALCLDPSGALLGLATLSNGVRLRLGK